MKISAFTEMYSCVKKIMVLEIIFLVGILNQSFVDGGLLVCRAYLVKFCSLPKTLLMGQEST